MSRRYLRLLLRWIRVLTPMFEEWPDRPSCGHFFGGVFWYGLETSNISFIFALAASSPEYDPVLAGISRQEARTMALKGLRYLCFTHDTGPRDCVRPMKTWGKACLAGTKWGETGKDLFEQSECGTSLMTLALTAILIHNLLGPEELAMLANIFNDYLKRFGQMLPWNGIYADTKTEENAWTGCGLVSSLVMLPKHPDADKYWETAKLRMFCSTTRPEDRHDRRVFADGQEVCRLACALTTHPDGTAENHGIVHPTYMCAALTLPAFSAMLLKLTQTPLPPHLFWRQKDTYNVLKSWTDRHGLLLPVQGMDWPYFTPSELLTHCYANCFLNDPDGALLERRVLAAYEKFSAANKGRLVVPEDVAKKCNGPQDPALFFERIGFFIGAAYLAQRLAGGGQVPSDDTEFEARQLGVRIYPHGGFALHRHGKGENCLSWRNSVMALPATKEGIRFIGPLMGSMLADIQTENIPYSLVQVDLKIRESADRIAVLLVQDLFQESLRRRVYFASLPNGKCVIFERVTAINSLVVTSFAQGKLSLVNDGMFGDCPDGKGRRHIFWNHGARIFEGFVSDDMNSDIVMDFEAGTSWINMDDQAGIIFKGNRRARYINRHFFKCWRALDDIIVLNSEERSQFFNAGDTVCELVCLWCPEQAHAETAREKFILSESRTDFFVAEVNDYICACNFTDQRQPLPLPLQLKAGRKVPVTCSVSVKTHADIKVSLELAAHEPTIIEL